MGWVPNICVLRFMNFIIRLMDISLHWHSCFGNDEIHLSNKRNDIFKKTSFYIAKTNEVFPQIYFGKTSFILTFHLLKTSKYVISHLYWESFRICFKNYTYNMYFYPHLI